MRRFEMIKDKNYFSYIIKHGKYNKDENYVVYYCLNKDNKYPHFGIAIKNKIGKAVLRNKLKRQTRSIIDNNKKLFKNYYDYIIMIRDGIVLKDYKTMENSLKIILKGINNNEKK